MFEMITMTNWRCWWEDYVSFFKFASLTIRVYWWEKKSLLSFPVLFCAYLDTLLLFCMEFGDKWKLAACLNLVLLNSIFFVLALDLLNHHFLTPRSSLHCNENSTNYSRRLQNFCIFLVLNLCFLLVCSCSIKMYHWSHEREADWSFQIIFLLIFDYSFSYIYL